MKHKLRSFFPFAIFLAAFVLWTLLVRTVDVRPIGPRDSSVGLAYINGAFHSLTGVHFDVYILTDWLGLVPVAVGFGFAIVGLVQWIRRKHIAKVDFNILVLGGSYLLTIAAYLLFEYVVINYRPVLINNYLEVSYPSSTTLLVLCVMPTAIFRLRDRITNTALKTVITVLLTAFIAFMVIGRLLSGVHWLSDIIGGILLSASIVSLYGAVCNLQKAVN